MAGKNSSSASLPYPYGLCISCHYAPGIDNFLVLHLCNKQTSSFLLNGNFIVNPYSFMKRIKVQIIYNKYGIIKYVEGRKHVKDSN
jgi:hypothetical protein